MQIWVQTYKKTTKERTFSLFLESNAGFCTWNFDGDDVGCGEQTYFRFTSGTGLYAAGGMLEVYAFEQVCYEAGIAPCLRVANLIGCGEYFAVFLPCLRGEMVTVFRTAHFGVSTSQMDNELLLCLSLQSVAIRWSSGLISIFSS